jgi:hypothetical protein
MERKSKIIFIPRIMTIIPEIRLIYPKTPPINMIVDEKITLKTIKTTLKPQIKPIVLAIGRGLDSLLSSKGELPITHRYDGISGNTQGDKKLSTPAPNAIKTDIFSPIY